MPGDFDGRSQFRVVEGVGFQLIQEIEQRQVIGDAEGADCVPDTDKEDFDSLFGNLEGPGTGPVVFAFAVSLTIGLVNPCPGRCFLKSGEIRMPQCDSRPARLRTV